MPKTSESISVLVRAALWDTLSLALLPLLLVGGLIRSLWRFGARQFRRS